MPSYQIEGSLRICLERNLVTHYGPGKSETAANAIILNGAVLNRLRSVLVEHLQSKKQN